MYVYIDSQEKFQLLTRFAAALKAGIFLEAKLFYMCYVLLFPMNDRLMNQTLEYLKSALSK